MSVTQGKNILYEAVTPAATLFLLLELDEIKLSERLEDILQITLGDAEMDIPYVESVKWYLIWVVAAGFRVASLAILLGFCELGDDGNS